MPSLLSIPIIAIVSLTNGGISVWQLLIVMAILLLLFGTSKLRNIGGDLGNVVKGFRQAMSDDRDEEATEGSKRFEKT